MMDVCQIISNIPAWAIIFCTVAFTFITQFFFLSAILIYANYKKEKERLEIECMPTMSTINFPYDEIYDRTQNENFTSTRRNILNYVKKYCEKRQYTKIALIIYHYNKLLIASKGALEKAIDYIDGNTSRLQDSSDTKNMDNTTYLEDNSELQHLFDSFYVIDEDQTLDYIY